MWYFFHHSSQSYQASSNVNELYGQEQRWQKHIADSQLTIVQFLIWFQVSRIRDIPMLCFDETQFIMSTYT